MAEHIQMIALSPTMEEGVIAKWNKNEGDKIATGDVICEVETDKATMDYESAQEGVLLKIVRQAGSSAKVGEVIGIVGAKGEDFSALLAAAGTAAPALAAVGAAGSVAATGAVQSSPANASAPSAAPLAHADSANGTQSSNGGTVKSSPLARRLAQEKGFDVAAVAGSGPGGRVIKRDVEGFTGQNGHAPAAQANGAVSAGSPASQAQIFAPTGLPATDVSIPIAGKRAIIAKRLSESMFGAPHFYLTNSVRMESLMEARTMLNKEVPPAQKVSFNAFIMKLCAEAIKRHPGINASWKGDSILQFGSVDIGLAVDLGNGLITPIVRNVGAKGVLQIDAELKVLIEKAGKGGLKPEEFTGATFTISNLGSFGVEEFTAIINPPGSAILALGEAKKTPVVEEDGSIGVASVMKMTLSCDHRVIDGALGGRFIKELSSMFENPVRVIF